MPESKREREQESKRAIETGTDIHMIVFFDVALMIFNVTWPNQVRQRTLLPRYLTDDNDVGDCLGPVTGNPTLEDSRHISWTQR